MQSEMHGCKVECVHAFRNADVQSRVLVCKLDLARPLMNPTLNLVHERSRTSPSRQNEKVSVYFLGGAERMDDNRTRILLADSELARQATIPALLKSDGYTIECCTDGLQAQARATSELFHLIILDAILPSRTGFEVCRHLRKNAVNAPILMLGTRDLSHKIEGFKSGSDDYLSKPFEITELQMRIEALLRRAYRQRQALQSYELDGTHIDFTNSSISRNGKTTALRKRECELLRYFIERKGQVFSRDELLRSVWGYSSLTRTRIVDVHVACLRRKIESDPKRPEHIITVHGEGYRFSH
jgi:DNA-binding response OmpR family regulator